VAAGRDRPAVAGRGRCVPSRRCRRQRDTRFDATTIDSFARSYDAIVATLPANDVPSLELAVERTLRYYALTTGRSLGPADLVNLFGGKTAEQVVAAAPAPDDPTLAWDAR